MKVKALFLLLLFTITSVTAQDKNRFNVYENHAPVFVKEMPDTVIDFGKTFKFTYKAIDEDGDKILYSSVNALPPRATFNDSTGVFSWKPLSWQAGKYEIIINTTDGKATTQSRKTKLSMVPTQIFHNEIKLSSSPSDGGTPDVSSIWCNDEDTITVKAKANKGYRFISWKEKDSVVSKDSVYTFVSFGNRNLIAYFRINHAPVFVYERKDSFYIIAMAPQFVFYFKAEDPDGDSIKYVTNSLLPYGAILTEKGIFSWRPSNEQRLHNTRIELVVIASDGIYKTYSQKTTIIAREVLSIEENSEIPIHFHLSQNYPNPFNPSTTIEYSIPKAEYITLKVFDVLGREVATLVNDYKQAGTYNCQLRIENGALPSGMYLYRLTAGYYTQTKKMILLK